VNEGRCYVVQLVGQNDDELHVCEDEWTAIKLTERFAMQEACKLLASNELEPGFKPDVDLVEWMNRERLIETNIIERFIISSELEDGVTVVSFEDEGDVAPDFQEDTL
jgi:hypothetical protein